LVKVALGVVVKPVRKVTTIVPKMAGATAVSKRVAPDSRQIETLKLLKSHIAFSSASS